MIPPSLARPRFVTTEEALGWHAILIARYGGASGLRDAGLLDSALAQPRQAFGADYTHEFPFGMAAAYAFHIAKNHPCVDGNKRLALFCCGAFLRMNGWDLRPAETEAATQIIALVEGTIDKRGMAEWLKGHSQPRPSLELRDFFALLGYAELSTMFSSLVAGQMSERVTTIMEAGEAMPAIHQANRGAASAEHAGKPEHAEILRQHALLLTAVYRVAEDMGYDW